MTPKERAEKTAAAMWARDEASQWMQLRLDQIDEGRAVMSLTVEPHHCNGHHICHGGITYLLADTAFAYACNSRNRSAVAQHNVISYIAPAYAGDVLTATAHELSLSGRSGIYDIRVARQDGSTVAEFRGMSRIIRGSFFDEEAGS